MKRILFLLTCIFWFPGGAFAADDLTTDQGRLSYTLGVQVGRSFLNQSIPVDAALFAQAIEDVLTGAEIRLKDAEMQAVMMQFQQDQVRQIAAQGEQNLEQGKKFLAENKAKEGVVTLPSGVQYLVLTQGDGPKPPIGASVQVHYRGTLISGEEFDSSYKRGEPTTLSLANVIKGWQEVVPRMPLGSKWRIFIPPESAYGERSAGPLIKPNSTLIFEIELLAIN